MERVILHSDLNSFYASVECLYNPAIRERPVAVCGSVEERHGIVLAANPLAKKFLVRTGDAVWQARQKCPELVVVEPHMDRYVRFSKAARDIYSDFSPCVEPFGLDENWIDLSGTAGLFGEGEQAADRIRERIKSELGITVSVGVSFNKSMAKLGSDYKKPDATTLITRENFQSLVWPLPVSDLLFVGRATTAKLHRAGIDTIGQLAKADSGFLRHKLGKNGLLLWQYANGIDKEPVLETGGRHGIKSVGNSTTTLRDMVCEDDIRLTATLLSESVAERMREKHLRCGVVQVYIRYSTLEHCQRQESLPHPSCTAGTIGAVAVRLILDNWTGEPLRSIGVRGCNLLTNEYPQLSLFPELQAEQRQEDLEAAVQDLRRRFGHFSVQRGMMIRDKPMADLDTRDRTSAQSVAFFRGDE